ncbi:MAG TPA: hypothetical protein VFI54_13890 [Solirubrobacteraceae bacterium]|nr:hypothetical protein [Solirubrobacteraceae bacterium]
MFTNASGNITSAQNCTLPSTPTNHSYHLIASEANNQAMQWSDPNTFALQ